MATNLTRKALVEGVALDFDTFAKVAKEYTSAEDKVVRADLALSAASLHRARVAYVVTTYRPEGMTNDEVGRNLTGADGKAVTGVRVIQLAAAAANLIAAGFDLTYSGTPDETLVLAYRQVEVMRKTSVPALPGESKRAQGDRGNEIKARALADVRGNLEALTTAVESVKATAKAGAENAAGTRGPGKEVEKAKEVKASTPKAEVLTILARLTTVLGEYAGTMSPEDLAEINRALSSATTLVEDADAAVRATA